MGTQLFLNLPVKDLNRSIAFFTALGYSFDPQFADDAGRCMIVSDAISVMLLTEAKFKELIPKPMADAKQNNEMIICLACESRQAVDDLVQKAVAAGGTTITEPDDYGFMYQHGYEDLDGHIWALIYMNKAEFPAQP